MTRSRAAAAVLGAATLLTILACANAAPETPEAHPCLGLTPPRVLAVHPVELPATYTAARLAAEIPAEATVGRDGAVGEATVRTAELAPFAPFAEETLKRSRFGAGSFEGNPVAIRVPVRVTVGSPRKDEARAPAEVWAYAAAGQSREARWQLRDSLTRVTVLAHVGRLAAGGATIVAVAPNGQTKTLVTVSPSDSPQNIRQTVATGKFFAGAGEYRLELHAGTVLASARLTIANDFTEAVINACETLPISRKAGPGS